MRQCHSVDPRDVIGCSCGERSVIWKPSPDSLTTILLPTRIGSVCKTPLLEMLCTRSLLISLVVIAATISCSVSWTSSVGLLKTMAPSRRPSSFTDEAVAETGSTVAVGPGGAVAPGVAIPAAGVGVPSSTGVDGFGPGAAVAGVDGTAVAGATVGFTCGGGVAVTTGFGDGDAGAGCGAGVPGC